MIEPLILYIILFLSGSVGQTAAPEGAFFSLQGELARLLLYTLPALALIWYLLLKVKNLKAWGVSPPGKKDLVPGLCALPALILIGFLIAFIAPRIGESAAKAPVFPENPAGWIILTVSCLGTGYLEESFFRFYLLSKRETPGLGAGGAALLSAAAFSICHIYEGPWGFLNAALSGAVLAFIFLRSRSLHGIALAHGLYNVFVYALAALQN
jgi:membrane protease YdiL (CAAX protease family)